MVEHANLGRLLRRGGWLGKTAAGAAAVMLSAGVAGSQGPETINVAPAPNPDASCTLVMPCRLAIEHRFRSRRWRLRRRARS